MKKIILIVLALFLTGAGCNSRQTVDNTNIMESGKLEDVTAEKNAMTTAPEDANENNNLTPLTMLISSPDFAAGGTIPQQNTCDGQDINPVLNISGVPDAAKSLALIVEDPDAPGGTFVHWVIWNMDPKTTTISENFKLGKTGVNDFDETRYGGPCPPANHRYFFRLYALDNIIEAKGLLNANQLLKEMSGHVLSEAELMGKYGPSK